jgi:ubiquinone/menaquinone biosynthesis C-methylase UbiE
VSDFIKKLWDSQAEKYSTHHSASWGDNFAIDLEVENIGRFIKAGDRVLDVGCANGHATMRQLNKGVQHITGIDFSELMINEANKNREEHKQLEKISFRTGDVRSIPFANDSFDVVYTTRTLINLPTWEEQQAGVTECVRVCRSGGVVVISEAFWEPLMLLNAMRALKSLPPLVEHDFNRYLKKSYLEKFLRDMGLKFDAVDFSSIYYLGSRFVRELVTVIEDYPGYSNPINKIFYEVEKEYSGGGFGIQQAYVLRK